MLSDFSIEGDTVLVFSLLPSISLVQKDSNKFVKLRSVVYYMQWYQQHLSTT